MTIILLRFRPLTGINFNIYSRPAGERRFGFRPLTGINFNLHVSLCRRNKGVSVPSRG